jgi:hypothetical protein
MKSRLFLIALFLASAANAADQKILVPIYYNAPGAGVTWRSALAITNKMSQPFRSPGVMFGIMCPIPEGCQSDMVPPGEFGALAVGNAPGGLLLLAPADEADKLVLRLEVGAAPRSLIVVGGTAIPIVRERDFRTGTITLPDVATHGDLRPLRTRLRIYDPDAHEGAQVRVSLRSWSTPTAQPVESKIITLHIAPVTGSGTPPPTPAYAEFDVAAMFPVSTNLGFNYNIDIEPVTPGLRLWAFATITDGITNEVTAVWPQ